MNRIIRLLLSAAVVFSVFTFTGCSTAGKLASPTEAANTAWEAGQYEQALTNYETVIEKYKSELRTAECPVYGKAGLAALKTGDKAKALDYFEMDTYTPFVTADTYYNMALLFREVDNLSREIMALSDYLEKFPNAAKADEVKLRLFETYIISENWDLAMDVWPRLTEAQQNDLKQLEYWFILNEALENNDVCDEIAEKLLERDSRNIKAMEWKAIRIFDQAEDRYNREMEAYEQNRTNRQYVRLLEELEKSTDEFGLALNYFKTLYNLDPKPRYALYMSNIYARFSDKERSDYYRRKAGK
jgi:tetratricopeptide (TPR) repeat protein